MQKLKKGKRLLELLIHKDRTLIDLALVVPIILFSLDKQSNHRVVIQILWWAHQTKRSLKVEILVIKGSMNCQRNKMIIPFPTNAVRKKKRNLKGKHLLTKISRKNLLTSQGNQDKIWDRWSRKSSNPSTNQPIKWSKTTFRKKRKRRTFQKLNHLKRW